MSPQCACSPRDLSPDPPTTSTAQPTGPTDSPTTSDSSGSTCCSSVMFQSSGDIAATQPDLTGSYRRISTDSTGRAVYRKDDTYLHYVNDVAHRFSQILYCKLKIGVQVRGVGVLTVSRRHGRLCYKRGQ